VITYKELSWSNIFSYGENNSIRLDQHKLAQLTGENGNGKSSIALILEEVQFNQNSKGLKRSDILNRYTKGSKYIIKLVFEKDGCEYVINVSRNSTTGTVKFEKDGKDISSHTATGTYKAIANVLGYDHKTFSQIVYQSSPSSLEFLTATDTARKKFLIDLLNLEIYGKASEVFKEVASGLNKQVDEVQAKIGTVSAWLRKLESEDLTVKDLKVVPSQPTSEIEKVGVLKDTIHNIEASNKRIITNNKYRDIVSSIEVDYSIQDISDQELLDQKILLSDTLNSIAKGKKLTETGAKPITKCPTCGSEMSNEHNYHMKVEFDKTLPSLIHTRTRAELKIAELEADKKRFLANKSKIAELEKYLSLIDKDLSSEVLDKDSLLKELADLSAKISKIAAEISSCEVYNKKVADHNNRVFVLLEQKSSMVEELSTHNEKLVELTKKLTDIQILVKTFSSTGLVAYKIECLVKDLEEMTNQFLLKLSDGRFQLSFKIAASDKLNVVISDNGNDIDIAALSNGEKARVNIASLLAIRKLTQTLSNSRTNLLILDETVENLDALGKERLVEILLEEEGLNTFLISHGFTHPLLEKINIVKENNISRIE
jgi:DNA repair exonuclease SbcCD ATPase subunit